jgi:hypothetical protein
MKMATIGTELKFVIGYTMFVSMMVYMIGLGGPAFVPADVQETFRSLTVPVGVPAYLDYPIIGAVASFIVGAYNNLHIFYTLLTFSVTIQWLSIIILTPYLIGMSYVIIKILRGGG